MRDAKGHTRFTVTMTGALLIFMGAAILANSGEVTAFVVRLLGFAAAVFGVMIFAGHFMRAHAIDAIPFEDLSIAGLLVLIGTAIAVFPNMFAKVLFSVMGILIVFSGLGDVARSRTKIADEENEEKLTLRVGIATVAVGVFVTLVPSAAIHVVPVICGVALVLDGLSELFLAMKMD